MNGGFFYEETAGLLNENFTLTASIKGGEGNYEMGKGRDEDEKDVDLDTFIK